MLLYYIYSKIIDNIISMILIPYVMTIISCQLHYRPADIPQSSLRTMAKGVRSTVLPNNDESQRKKPFAEGIEYQSLPCR